MFLLQILFLIFKSIINTTSMNVIKNLQVINESLKFNMKTRILTGSTSIIDVFHDNWIK